MLHLVGWDIGGANLKAAGISYENGGAYSVSTLSRPFEIWRRADQLPDELQSMLKEVAEHPPQAMALTMTAELSDVFRTKREGVVFVLHSLQRAFPHIPCFAFSLAGEFVSLEQALHDPLAFAASNWLATAKYLARQYPDCLLVDVGSTTTDIIPVHAGQVHSQGRTDFERLVSGELVYTGLLRTHLAAIVRAVPVHGQYCPVSSEYFAISGDVHLILGHIQAQEYDCPTPDGRPPTLDSARQRLARLVCADTETLSAETIDRMAGDIYQQQLDQIGQALRKVLSRLPDSRSLPVVALGSGAFLALQAAQRAGLPVVDLAAAWGRQASQVAPCLAVACLLAQQMESA